MPFFLTGSYIRVGEKRRMFPREHDVFWNDSPESWRQVRQLIHTGILRIFLRSRNREPTEFTFYGRRPTLYGDMKVLQIACVYNPLSDEIKITRARFADDDAAMYELKRQFYYIELGKRVPAPRRARLIRLTELPNPLEGRSHAPEPPANEYGSPMDRHSHFFREPRTTAPREPSYEFPK